MKPVISSKNTKGMVNFTKSMVHSIANIASVSPRSLALFLALCSYADDNGSLITDNKTLSHLVKTETRKIDYCLRTLQEHGLIEIHNVNIKYNHDIFGKIHDKQNYYKTNKQEWNITGDRYLTTITISGTYKRIYLNKEYVSFANGYYNTLLLYVKNNLYYDTRLSDNQIIEER